jgi:dethiobiotin synthetase
MNIELQIIIFLIIFTLILLFYKNNQTIKTVPLKPILKKENEKKIEQDKKNLKDIRKSQQSNTVTFQNNKTPTPELIKMYEPARENIPIDKLPFCHNGRTQFEQLRFNI